MIILTVLVKLLVVVVNSCQLHPTGNKVQGHLRNITQMLQQHIHRGDRENISHKENKNMRRNVKRKQQHDSQELRKKKHYRKISNLQYQTTETETIMLWTGMGQE